MGKFEFVTRVVREAAILKAKGYLSGHGGEKLEREIERLIGDGSRRFVINFKETDMVNSVGVSILIGVIERVRECQGELYFSELGELNEEIFRLMGLHSHARIIQHDNEIDPAQ